MPIYEENDTPSMPSERGVVEWVQVGVYFLVFLLVAILVLPGPAIGNVFSNSQMMGAI
ncbi:MAG: hypothetical protein JW918_09340 [Anaerolineae bacterium]|nr:hypothetical protein [Anaerolineae bacterium]